MLLLLDRLDVHEISTARKKSITRVEEFVIHPIATIFPLQKQRTQGRRNASTDRFMLPRRDQNLRWDSSVISILIDAQVFSVCGQADHEADRTY